MGGLLALHLGLSRKPSGVLSLSAPIHIRDLRFRGLAVFRFVQRWTRELAGGVGDPDAPPHVTYPVCPTQSLYQMKLLADGVSARLHELKAPLLILHGRRDSMVPPDNAAFLYGKAGSRLKHLVYLDRSDHVLPLDLDKEEVFQKAARFVSSHGRRI